MTTGRINQIAPLNPFHAEHGGILVVLNSHSTGDRLGTWVLFNLLGQQDNIQSNFCEENRLTCFWDPTLYKPYLIPPMLIQQEIFGPAQWHSLKT